MLEQKLNETRTRKAMEISEMDGRLHDEYEQQMQKNLQELRDSYEKQMAENKDQFTQMYEDKLRNLQEKFDFERQNSAGKMQEFRELETKVTGLISRNKELESTNTSLQKRMAELTQAMDDKLAQFRADMARKVNKQHMGLCLPFAQSRSVPGCRGQEQGGSNGSNGEGLQRPYGCQGCLGH